MVAIPFRMILPYATDIVSINTCENQNESVLGKVFLSILVISS